MLWSTVLIPIERQAIRAMCNDKLSWTLERFSQNSFMYLVLFCFDSKKFLFIYEVTINSIYGSFCLLNLLIGAPRTHELWTYRKIQKSFNVLFAFVKICLFLSQSLYFLNKPIPVESDCCCFALQLHSTPKLIEFNKGIKFVW